MQPSRFTPSLHTTNFPVAAINTQRPKPLETPRLSPLAFKEITLADLPGINRIIRSAANENCSRTCDYTIGGIFMWIDFFDYRFCIYRDTLFICGVSEKDDMSTAFSLPIGKLPLAVSIGMLRDYCELHHLRLRFSAIPADRIDDFRREAEWIESELTDWSDYLYDIEALATLTGKRYNKKRNHVNRFFAENPDAELVPITTDNVAAVKSAYMKFTENEITDDSDDDIFDFGGYEEYDSTRIEEQAMTISVLDNLDNYPFEGVYLTDGRRNIVAFSLAEIIGDTAYIHIEKMDHSVAGAGETINKMFAGCLLKRYPELKFANREEDCGDPSLRYTKQSYHPSSLLRKFDLEYLGNTHENQKTL